MANSAQRIEGNIGLKSRIVRDMAATLRRLRADPYDRSLCWYLLWEHGYREAALNLCLDAARTMTTIRTRNEQRDAL